LANLSAEKRRLLLNLLREDAARDAAAQGIPRRQEHAPGPLSYGQRRLWFLDRLVPGSPAYNLPFALRLCGRLDPRRLDHSLAKVLERHEVLRTHFAMGPDGEPVQVVAAAAPLPFSLIDLSALPRGMAQGRASVLMREEARRPFSLSEGPLFRAGLLRLAGDEHIALFSVHHAVFDGWSTGLFIQELGAIYQALETGRPPALPKLPIQYSDYAAWQRRRLQGETLEPLLAYWREQLRGAPPVLDLPADRTRPAMQSFRGASCSLSVGGTVATELRRLGEAAGATPFMVLLAAYQALLGRATGRTDFLVGTPIANRNRIELEPLIGFFVNTLALRADLSGRTGFGMLVRRTSERVLGAYDHQDLPFEKLLDELAPPRSLAYNPLIQVSFALQNAPSGGSLHLGEELVLETCLTSSGTAQFDLSLAMTESSDGLGGEIQYNFELFEASTVERFASHFAVLLAAVAASPEACIWDLPLLSEPERQQILVEWGRGREASREERCLHELILEQAARTPEAVAVLADEGPLTYAELAGRAARLAGRLATMGVAPETPVAIAVERSLDMMVGLLGILIAGGAYVPLDPEYPLERLERMAADALHGLPNPVLLTQEHLRERLPGLAQTVCLDSAEGTFTAPVGDGPAPRVSADGLAYVIYTSGSTGRPKGVMISHRAIVNRLLWMQETYGLAAGERVLQKTSISFDVSVWELFWPLMAGATLVLARPGGQRDSAYLVDLIARREVTTLHFVPSMLQIFLEGPEVERCRSLRRVVASGEALPASLVARFFSRLGAELHNLYGPTEAAVDVTAHACRPDRLEAIPIGRPIANLEILLLDAALQPVAAGWTGELYIGGMGLARGYLGQPGLTAASFVPHPAGGAPGLRLYRTGDLARHRPDGEIEYLGRADHQVKVRGFRIEPAEIEAALCAHPGVAEAVVVARQEEGETSRRLVAYVVGSGGDAPSPELLRRHLAERLPAYMVPAVFVALAELPLTPSGKVDRKALPAPGSDRSASGEEYVAPSLPVEEVLCGIWSAVLRIDRIGVRDNFFSLGGDSILSLRVVALAGERGLPLALPDLFRHQTVAALAECLATRLGREADGDGILLASEPFSLLAEADRARLPEDLEDAYPVSMLQAGMLVHMALSPEDPAYHNVDSWHLKVRLEPAPFAAAVQQVMARHPMLRTSFSLHGYSEPLQLVHRTAELPVPFEDIRDLLPEDQEALIDRRIASEKSRPFDLERAPQLRLHVYQRSDHTAQLTVVENHAIFDGWSLHATLAEIFDLYFALLAGVPATEPPLSLTYRHYVALEREALKSPAAQAFWSAQLAGRPLCELPHWPLPAPPQGLRMRDLGLPVPPAVLVGLAGLARRAAVPLKSVFLVAHLAVLSRLSGQSDVTTGLVTNGRMEEAGGDEVRGMFLNTLPFRLDLGAGEGSWLDLARRAFALEQDLLAHRRYPLAALQRAWGDQPLFEVAFNYIHFHVVRDLLESGRVEVLGGRGAEGASFKLFAHCIRNPQNDRMDLHLEYDSHALPRAAVESILGRYARVFAVMAQESAGGGGGEAPFLSDAERHQALWEWNDTEVEETAQCLAELFEEQARRTPDTAALLHAGRILTYRELDRRADELACRLQALGVGPESTVGLCVRRSPALVIGVLGILKAGGAYVPLDPAYPHQRLLFMLEDARAAFLVTEDDLRELVPEGLATVLMLSGVEEEPEEAGRPARRALPESLAYLIYTSGSTGRPKGVAIEHRSAVSFVRWALTAFSPEELSGVLAATSLAFDLSVFELFVPLCGGGRVILAANALELQEIPAAGEVRLVNTVPSVLAELLASAALPPAVRTVSLAGEALPRELVARVFELPGMRRVLNLYGPSEDTTYSTGTALSREDGGPPAIGRSLAGKRLHVVDRELRLAPLGTAGEMVLGGQGLARGYLGRPELTAERFVPDPFSLEPGRRLYRTGDLGRRRPDGEVEFLGRLDQQVKLRGFRIEPGEIEAALARHPAVRRALVMVREDRPGQARLVAYVVARGEGPNAEPEGLRDFLRADLPEHMVPAAWVFLDALPLLPNGKVDRRALPAPEWAAESDYVEPRGSVEEAVATVWREILGVDRVGRNDNFFDLGGHSLLMVPLRSRLQERFQREIPMLAMFRYATVGAMAAHLQNAQNAQNAEAESLEMVRRARREGLQLGRDRLQQRLRQRGK
jgi:amino acid adenylation domain-containing protein